MPEPHEHRPPWGDGPPPWGGRTRWDGGPGRRFRRGAFVFLAVLVLLVAGLATLVASIVTGNAPSPGITVAVAAVVVVGIVLSARWLWRNARTLGALIDASDRVAGGDYAARVDPASGQLGRMTGAFNEMASRLETNERRRRELLADIAHELRTPLQVIRGSVEGMLDGLYPTERDRLQGVVDETELMARLLDDLRTLSMADEGVLVLDREPTEVGAIAEDAVRPFEDVATAGGVTLTLDRDDVRTIEADPVRVAEVMSNLVSNAIRHTPGGGTVTVRVRDDGGGVLLEVDDTGPGIAPDQRTAVFDRFVRSADTGGSGLGLAIAKRLVDAHGGTIEALEAPGGGTRMRVTLPG
jgi:two-component system, OmpR family, sensor histidine kinase BaeS